MPSSPTATRAMRLAPFAIVLAVGTWLGYEMAYSASEPGLFRGLSLVFGFIGIGVLSLVLLVIATVAARRPDGAAQATDMRAGVGLLVLGSIAGTILTPAFGLGYHAPVVLESQGTSNLELMGVPDFAAASDAATTCQSIADGRAVAMVSVNAAGLLRGARVLVGLDFASPGQPPQITITLGGESPLAAAAPVLWGGPLSEPPAAELSGRATFANLPLQGFDKGEPAGSAIVEQPALTPDPSVAGWPRLSGTFTWSCGDYTSGPNGPLAGQPTPRRAHIDVELAGVDWISLPGDATCDGGALMGTAGNLQGTPFTVELDLGKAVVGGQIDIAIKMDLQGSKDPPSGLTFAPSWEGPATVTELGPARQKGEVTFTRLATGVDPANGPAPSNWPTTVTGSMTWDCGPG